MATIYYVDIDSVGGVASDSNNGITLTTPFLTIGKAESVVVADDTILIRAGTYPDTQANSGDGQFFSSLPSGTTASNYTKVGAYNNETVILQNTRTSTHSIVNLPQGAENIWFDGLILDGADIGAARAVTAWNIGYEGSNVLYNTNIKCTDIQAKNFSNQGMITGTLQDSLVSGFTAFDNDTNGDDFAHGLYISGNTRNNIFEDITIYNIAGHCIQFNSSGGGNPSGNIIQRFRIFKGGRYVNPSDGKTKPNLVLFTGSNNTLREGVCYDGSGGGLHVRGTSNALYHILSTNNGSNGLGGSAGIAIIGGSGNLVKNCISLDQHASAPFGNYADVGSGTITSNNLFAGVAITDLCTDPNNANRLIADYSYIASPTAGDQQDAHDAVVDQGTSVGSPISFTGVTRPQGVAVDIGPDEFGADPPDAPGLSHEAAYTVSTIYGDVTVTLVKGTNNIVECTLSGTGAAALCVDNTDVTVVRNS